MVPATGLVFLLSPLVSLLEGCNQVAAVNAYRLVAGVVASVAIWSGMWLGAGLYAIALAAGARLLWTVSFLGWRYRAFLVQLFRTQGGDRIAWRREMLGFQAKIAVSWACGYFVYQLLNPVVFHYHGAAAAGQMGMTLALCSYVSATAFSWVQTRIPTFGVLAARREHQALDRLVLRLLGVSLMIDAAGAACLVGAVAWLRAFRPEIGARLLPVLPTILLLMAYWANLPVSTMAAQLRAYKREPLMWLSVRQMPCYRAARLASEHGSALSAPLSRLLAVIVTYTPPRHRVNQPSAAVEPMKSQTASLR